MTIEVQKGIYLIDEELSNPTLDTLVVMHPYYGSFSRVRHAQISRNKI